jgi:hypothetical protein
VAERTTLLQILRKPPDPAAERCEFCGAGIDDPHGHLVDLPRRMLLCVCRPCHLLFMQDGAGGARFRAVPERYRELTDFAAAEDSWSALQLPIGLAFFLTDGATGRTTGFYPSPAGATESQLSLDTWADLIRNVPALADLQPDVEALIVRSSDTYAAASPARPSRAFIVPIDVCYELVGRIRRGWRGMQGGDEVWRDVDDFFARIVARARESAA